MKWMRVMGAAAMAACTLVLVLMLVLVVAAGSTTVVAQTQKQRAVSPPSPSASAAETAIAIESSALGVLHGTPTALGLTTEFDDAPFQVGEVRGKVVRVVDGDTFWLVREGSDKPMKVRIEGIDAPEICQDYGPEARRELAQRILDRDVTVKLRAVDDWGRRIGIVYDGGVNVGQRLVRDGYAFSIRYRWDRGPYIADERMAQSFFRGLHAAGEVELPREFRKRHGSCQTEAPTPAKARGGGGR